MPSFLYNFAEYFIVPIFLLSNISIALWAYVKEPSMTFKDYTAVKPSSSTFVLIMTLLAVFVTHIDLAGVQKTIFYGSFSWVAIGIYFIFSIIVGIFLLPKLTKMQGHLTIGDLMGAYFGPIAKFVTGLTVLVMSFFVFRANLSIMQYGVRFLLGDYVNTTSLSYFVLLIIPIYLLSGGMHSMRYTNVIQMGVGITVLVVLTIGVINIIGGFTHIIPYVKGESAGLKENPDLLSYLKRKWIAAPLYTLIWAVPVFQRLSLVKETKKARKVWYLSNVLYITVSLLISLIGFSILVIADRGHLPVSLGEMHIFMLIKFLFYKQTIALKVIYIGFLGILLSSLDTYLHVAGVVLVHDVIKPCRNFFSRKELKDEDQLLWTRLGTLFLCLLFMLMTLIPEYNFYFNLHRVLCAAATTIIVPLLIAMLGLKTNMSSWMSFCAANLVSIVTLYFIAWNQFSVFFSSLIVGVIAYLIAHVIANRGFEREKKVKKVSEEASEEKAS